MVPRLRNSKEAAEIPLLRPRAASLFGIGLAAAIAAGLLARLISTRAKGPIDLQSLLHGSKELGISRIEFDRKYQAVPRRVVLTNQTELEFLSRAFRESVTNRSGGGTVFEAKIGFTDNSSVRAVFQLPDDYSYVIVSGPT